MTTLSGLVSKITYGGSERTEVSEAPNGIYSEGAGNLTINAR